MIATTADRVESNTAAEINEKIRHRTEMSIACYSNADSPAIKRRLQELGREWDIERYLETMAPTLTLVGLTLSITKSRKWLLLPILVQSFFLQHALQGWCPPIPVLRRLGVRTTSEIQDERVGLEELLEKPSRAKRRTPR